MFVTKFVTKTLLCERKNFLADSKNYLADNENYLADSGARNGLCRAQPKIRERGAWKALRLWRCL